MKNPLIVFTYALGALWSSCAGLADRDRATGPDSLSVTFAVTVPETETVTRALSPEDERQVRDLNIYLFHKTTDIRKHLFSDDGAGQITATLVRGDYDVFVIANAGGDTGELTREEAERFSLSVPGESGLTAAGGLPMSARLSVSVSGTAVIPVSLVRCTAKVTLSLRVDERIAGEIALQSVRVGHAPGTVALFSDNRAAESALIDYAKRSVTGNAFSGTFYIPENLQGVNASITDQRDKSAANAPAAATCLDIRAVAEGREIAYRIYPGANNTTDFNLERNHHYVIDATIRGADAIDTRVSTVDLTFGAIKNPCNVGETVTSSVTVKCTNSPNRQIYLAAQIVEGGGALTVNGSAWPPGAAMPFCKGNETRTVPVTLVPSRSGLIRIRFTVSDDAGYITYLELTTYCQQSYPVTTVFSENSWSKTAHTPLTFSVKANQQNNTSGFTIRYELLKGAGDMYYGGIKLSDGQSLTSGANDPATGLTFPFSFTPTVIGTVSFRLTFTGANGQASVVEKTYTGIVPYKIDITPDFAKIQPAGTTVTSDGYSGTYYKNFTIRLLASTDKAVPKPVTLRIGLQYKLGEYETSLTPTVTTQTKTGTVTLSAGSKTGYTDLVTYAASCIGYNAGMGSKIIYPGFYMVPKQNYETNEHSEDASVTSCKITSDADSSIEFTLLTPPK